MVSKRTIPLPLLGNVIVMFLFLTRFVRAEMYLLGKPHDIINFKHITLCCSLSLETFL